MCSQPSGDKLHNVSSSALPWARKALVASLQIDRVLQHDGRRHLIEAAGPVALLLRAAVAKFPQAVEEHGAASALRASPLFSPVRDAAAQLHAL